MTFWMYRVMPVCYYFLMSSFSRPFFFFLDFSSFVGCQNCFFLLFSRNGSVFRLCKWRPFVNRFLRCVSMAKMSVIYCFDSMKESILFFLFDPFFIFNLKKKLKQKCILIDYLSLPQSNKWGFVIVWSKLINNGKMFLVVFVRFQLITYAILIKNQTKNQIQWSFL